jgi:hypothetical protein
MQLGFSPTVLVGFDGATFTVIVAALDWVEVAPELSVTVAVIE